MTDRSDGGIFILDQAARLTFRTLFACTVLFLATSTSAAGDDGVSLDKASGDYILSFKNTRTGKVAKQTFIPATKIAPVVITRLEPTTDGKVRYSYLLTNLASARQAISDFQITSRNNRYVQVADEWPVEGFDIASKSATSLIIPPHWHGMTLTVNFRPTDEYRQRSSVLDVIWFFQRGGDFTSGLVPGQSQDGFSFVSSYLPGVGYATIAGATPPFDLPFQGTEISLEMSINIDRLKAKDHVKLPILVPMLPARNYSALTILMNLRDQLSEREPGTKHLSYVQASYLFSLTSTAIEYARAKNFDAMKRTIKDMMNYIDREFTRTATTMGADQRLTADDVAIKSHRFYLEYILHLHSHNGR